MLTPTLSAANTIALAEMSEDPVVLFHLASQPHLHAATQLALAVNEHGEMVVDATDDLSSAHAVLLGRDDLDSYVARILLEVNTPQMHAAVAANLNSPVVRHAATISHVRQYRELASK